MAHPRLEIWTRGSSSRLDGTLPEEAGDRVVELTYKITVEFDRLYTLKWERKTTCKTISDGKPVDLGDHLIHLASGTGSESNRDEVEIHRLIGNLTGGVIDAQVDLKSPSGEILLDFELSIYDLGGGSRVELGSTQRILGLLTLIRKVRSTD